MILSGKMIHERLGRDLIIEPFDPARLNPNSYNLSLADKLVVYEADILDMKKKKPHSVHSDTRRRVRTATSDALSRTNGGIHQNR